MDFHTRRESIHVGAPGGEPVMRRLLIPYISCIRHILPSEREKLTLRGIDHRRPLHVGAPGGEPGILCVEK